MFVSNKNFQVLPRLWPFFNHSSSSVRKATLQTLQTLTGEDSDNEEKRKERWGEGGGFVLQEALRHVFQRVLIEHVPSIQEIAERVWENLVVRSDLEMLLHAACPLVSTWLCLAMQPEHVPFNLSLLMNVSPIHKTTKSSQPICDGVLDLATGTNNIHKPTSELKIYLGGVETVSQNTRHANVVRARCMTSKMLGILSSFLVMPAPGVVYTPEIPSPALCYAKVLMAHLNSKSALQRTIVGLTMSYWAALDYSNLPDVPAILRYLQYFYYYSGCLLTGK